MGKQIFTGRYTTENDGDIVVFIIGMRINSWLAVHKWFPVFAAMPPMIKELYTHQDELGFLSMENFFGLRTTVMIQYWRSMEDLLAYARAERHLTAWRNFNRKVENNKAVGIYHESYQIKKENYESVYANMPLHGLSKALPHIPITNELNGARKRLKDV
jgi:heme-degrading monooxygenase HmoA